MGGGRESGQSQPVRHAVSPAFAIVAIAKQASKSLGPSETAPLSCYSTVPLLPHLISKVVPFQPPSRRPSRPLLTVPGGNSETLSVNMTDCSGAGGRRASGIVSALVRQGIVKELSRESRGRASQEETKADSEPEHREHREHREARIVLQC